MVGKVPVGGDAPISVQSMTNTPTPDVAATVGQIQQLEEAGADIVRVSCPDEARPPRLRKLSNKLKCQSLPISIFTTKGQSKRLRPGCVPAH